MRNKEIIRFPLVKLREGSWYGDYQIMLKVKSTWELEATKEPKHNDHFAKIPAGKMHVFTLEDKKFMKIVNKYPVFRRFMLMRSKMRRCHFRKVYEENRHIYILNQKKQHEDKLQRALGKSVNISEDSVSEMDDIWGGIEPRKYSE